MAELVISDSEVERLRDECAAAGVLDDFERILATDGSARFAAMCALQTPPRTTGTDRTFCEGAHRAMEDMPDAQRQAILRIARRAGINTAGKFYKGGLGRYDDPAAWVATADDVLAVAKARNFTVRGAVHHQGRLPEGPPKKIALAPDLVARETKRLLKADPALAEKVNRNPKKLREVQEQVVARHGRQR